MKTYLWRYLCLALASISIFLFWQNTSLTLILMVIFSVLVNVGAKTHEIVYFVAVSILASIVESITISSGAWIYTTQNILNLPIWIPLYWGIGGVAMKDIYLILKNKILN